MIGEHRLDANLGGDNGDAAGLHVAGEGNAAGVGGLARRELDGVELSQLMLVLAVVIHGPDFLVAVAIAYESDLRAGDSRQTARQLANDLIGELMGKGSNLRI